MKALKNIYKKYKLNKELDKLAKQYGIKRRKAAKTTTNDFWEYCKNSGNIREFSFPAETEKGVFEADIKSILPFGKKEINYIKAIKPCCEIIKINNKSMLGNKVIYIK
jgi:hypothetical protein